MSVCLWSSRVDGLRVVGRKVCGRRFGGGVHSALALLNGAIKSALSQRQVVARLMLLVAVVEKTAQDDAGNN